MDTDLIKGQITSLKNKPQLNRRERRYLAKLEKKLLPDKKANSFQWNGTVTKFFIGLFVLLIVGGVIWITKSQPNLPPIDMEGHIEQNPPSHISDQEMPEPIQKHMLEHADGDGESGVIIQYNCKMYSCEKDTIEKLKSLVKKYPENVYLAQGNYDGMIILTKNGQREILEKLDEKKIKEFIIN
ncbi:hypothetical protein A3I50_02325 [Candidatus Roizmanbacteria bacterium RIFCSPLOWO2_02_FULL_37_9]|nr:MAG: hypothetical protein A3I50_02325 [Candidatus Roizmanbacteria bacterium RIFCSPLOWO2_02_FULL_37_9]